MEPHGRASTYRGILVQASLVMLMLSCTFGADRPPDGAPGTETARPPRGGTLRVVMPADSPFGNVLSNGGDPSTLDPAKSELIDSGPIFRCCLARTLLSHNGHSTEQDGSTLYPDLASSRPEIGADGLTWTFELRSGVRYAPPLDDVEVTARDFVRSFHRLLAPEIGSFYGQLVFADVEGATAYSTGEAASISGLEAPNDRTFVIRLTKPAGDLGIRLALPFTTPLPPSPADPSAPFGVADGHDDGYGPFLVSSGPYMIKGAALVDFTAPATDRVPASGIVPNESLTLVRNPSWSRGEDPLRSAYADRIVLSSAASLEDAVAVVAAGRADVLWNMTTSPTVPPELASEFRGESARGHVYVDSYGSVRGVGINLAVPPFDDVHVRRALNYAVDKQRLVDILGGPLAAEVAGHMAPNSVEDNLLVDFDPYATPAHRGDPAAAAAEIARSAYDANGDGRCDAPSCQNVPAVVRTDHASAARVVRENLRPLGIELEVRVVTTERFFGMFGDPRLRIAIWVGIGWSQSYLGAASFFLDQFYSPVAISDDYANSSLVGASRSQLRRWGYEPVDVPNVDARIEACVPLVGAAQFACWAGLDQYLMREVVPWVPYAFERFVAVTSPRVVSYSYDQLALAPALDQIAVRD
jgi:peptide/nickel transport system substrate-binding protein